MEKREELPGELLRRARESARLRRTPPAPSPQENDAPSFVPRHAVYSALMRSHDRVNTQHIAGKT